MSPGIRACVVISKHHLAAVLQIGRLFTTPALLHAKVNNKCRNEVVHVNNKVVLTRKKRKAKTTHRLVVKHLRKFVVCYTPTHPLSRLASGVTPYPRTVSEQT